MISDIQDIVALVRRLEEKRNTPPQPLSRQRDHDRDVVRDVHVPMPEPERGHKRRSQPLPNVWDWRSRQM